jgi:hypothetical protein
MNGSARDVLGFNITNKKRAHHLTTNNISKIGIFIIDSSSILK